MQRLPEDFIQLLFALNLYEYCNVIKIRPCVLGFSTSCILTKSRLRPDFWILGGRGVTSQIIESFIRNSDEAQHLTQHSSYFFFDKLTLMPTCVVEVESTVGKVSLGQVMTYKAYLPSIYILSLQDMRTLPPHISYALRSSEIGYVKMHIDNHLFYGIRFEEQNPLAFKDIHYYLPIRLLIDTLILFNMQTLLSEMNLETLCKFLMSLPEHSIDLKSYISHHYNELPYKLDNFLAKLHIILERNINFSNFKEEFITVLQYLGLLFPLNENPSEGQRAFILHFCNKDEIMLSMRNTLLHNNVITKILLNFGYFGKPEVVKELIYSTILGKNGPGHTIIYTQLRDEDLQIILNDELLTNKLVACISMVKQIIRKSI